MTELELRYRRILAWYPTDFRALYEEEMVGVLMEGARPEQRYPEPREVASLAGGALRRRFGGAGDLFADRRWSDATAVFGVLAPIVLLAERLRAVPYGPLLFDPVNDEMTVWAVRHWGLPVLAMAVVAVAALAGWRLVAAVAAWLAVAGQLGILGLRYTADPVQLVFETVPLTLTVTAAAALSVPNPGAHGRRLLGWPRIGLMLTAGGLWAAGGVDTRHHTLLAPYGTDGLFVTVGLVLAAGLLWFLLRRTEPGVRRRVLVLIAPTAATILLVKFGLAGFIVSSPRFYPTPVLLVPGQWLALGLTPLLIFAAGALLVRRWDETERLMALGRAAERPPAETPAGHRDGLSSADD